MSRMLRHVRQNVVAYLALFVALGGTSYAAISIPRNSVGASQIRNHSVQPVKLDGKYFGGYIRLWAQIDGAGHLVSSRPRGASIPQWNNDPSRGLTGGTIRWPGGVPAACFPVVSAVGFDGGSSGPATATAELNGPRNHQFVVIFDSHQSSVNVLVVCPGG